MSSAAGAPLPGEDAVQVGDVDAGRILLHADEVRLGIPERRHRACIRRQLDERRISGIEEHARAQVERMCEQLLANALIESYEIELGPAA